MSLYWPDAEADVVLGQPRLHALVIGVGDYPHLVGGGGHPAVANFGLQQLTTTPLTGARIAEWLLGSYRNPACPLGSIELLLSPAAQVDRADGAKIAVEAAKMDEIRKASKRWRDRCHTHAGNVAWFYFAGHGLTAVKQHLLASDFGDPNVGNLWANSIDVDGLRTGMRANDADTQLFFVDACREKPIDALVQLNPNGDPLCSASLFDQVASSAAYHAAADGMKAYGPANDVTFFATALLDALDGSAAFKQQGTWRVDTHFLGAGIAHVLDILRLVHGEPLTCNPDPDGKVATIHFPDPPLIRAAVYCQTKQANDESTISLQRGADPPVSSAAGEKRPWTGRVGLGSWDINFTFQSFPPVTRKEEAAPPVLRWEEPI